MGPRRAIGPDPAPEGGFVGDYLLYLLASASEAASASFHAEVQAEGLRAPEWRVLACLRDEDGQMATQLAQIALLEQSRLTKTIDQMAEKGLVLRQSDADDRRRVRVRLTPRGRALADRLVAGARAHERELAAQFAPGELRRLKDLLKRLRAHCGAEPGAMDGTKKGATG